MSWPSKLLTTARTSGTFVRKICSSSGIRSNSAVSPPSSFHGFSCSAGQISECESFYVHRRPLHLLQQHEQGQQHCNSQLAIFHGLSCSIMSTLDWTSPSCKSSLS